MSEARAIRPCGLVPTYDDPWTVRDVVAGLRRHLDTVIVVDDGSAEPGRGAARALDDEGLARVIRRARNGGKGAAVLDGLRLARELGFTHALQVDADGQHDLDDLPRFLAAARAAPDALVTGEPVFDASAPWGRRVGRLVSVLWVALECGGRVVRDPLCGFRVYPVEAALAARPRTRRMDFDPEVAVRMVWNGARVVNLPTRVRYPDAGRGGSSHYRLVRDNLAMTLLHSRLSTEAPARLLALGLRRRGRP